MWLLESESANRALYRYDGTPATGLPWAASRPQNSVNKTLVTINRQGTITDREPTSMNVLCCKSAATPVSYDATARFN